MVLRLFLMSKGSFESRNRERRSLPLDWCASIAAGMASWVRHRMLQKPLKVLNGTERHWKVSRVNEIGGPASASNVRLPWYIIKLMNEDTPYNAWYPFRQASPQPTCTILLS
jgi:hypothetical protein